MWGMAIAHSKITAQGQISVPAEVRKRLEVGPGSVLEWEAQGDAMIVRKVARYTIDDVHHALFPEGQPAKGKVDIKDAIRTYIRRKHARD